MSIHEKVQHLIGGQEAYRNSLPKTARLVEVENKGGQPVVGLTYRTDYRYEEENGIGEIRNAFMETMNASDFFAVEHRLMPEYKTSPQLSGKRQVELVKVYDDVVAFCITAEPWDLDNEIKEARKDFSTRFPSRSNMKFSEYSALKWGSKKNAMDEAARRKIVGRSKMTKDQLIKAIVATEPDSTLRSGSLHFGNALVIERTDDQFGEFLDYLVAAAENGTLYVGNASGPFHSGITLLDARDVSDESKDEIADMNAFYRQAMEDLTPVVEEMRERGHFAYALGNPSKFKEGETRYFLNSTHIDLGEGFGRHQVYGWFTLAELSNGEYIEAMRDKLRKRTEAESDAK